MKISIVLAVLTATLITAAPTAVSHERSVDDVTLDGNTAAAACIECPCYSFFGPCQCVYNGCCAGNCVGDVDAAE